MGDKILQKLGLMVFAGVVFLGGCIEEGQKENSTLKVFHAGSLSEVFFEVEKEFEKRYNIDVQREAAGSVQTIKKVTELNKEADIIASADAYLIQKMMYPKYSNFTIKFATNEIVIAYTNKSKYKNEINKNNWYQILRRDEVKFGFSNPNNDPCGYRSVMVIQLAEFKYNDSKIFDDLIEKNTNIKSICENLTCIIIVPPSPEINPNVNKIMIRSMEMELITGLQSGEIDYLFIYKSIAIQYKFNFIELPSEINLKNETKNKIYENVKVKLADDQIQQGSAIIYGITIPKNARNKKEAIKFIKFLIDDGREIFERLGHPPIVPAIADNITNVPDELKNFMI